jgi:hypothetical protein
MAEEPSKPGAGSDDDRPTAPDGRRPRDLTSLERSLAGVIGIAGAVVGGAGIFLSDNQAGTAIILLLGVVFLIMAVQGTAIRRITKEGGDFADRSAERAAVERVQATLEDKGTSAAQAALDAATAASPDLERSPAVGVISATLYERVALNTVGEAWRKVVARAARAATEPVVTWSSIDVEPDRGIDAVLTAEGIEMPSLAVEVAYTQDSLFPRNRLAGLLRKLDQVGSPYIVISSSRASPTAWEAWQYSPRATPRQFVHWQPGFEVATIEVALERLIGQATGDIPLDQD